MLEDQKRQQAEKAERDAAKELVRLQQYNIILYLPVEKPTMMITKQLFFMNSKEIHVCCN